MRANPRLHLLVCALLVAAFAAPPQPASVNAVASIQTLRPNVPPETVLGAGPPDSANATSYRAHFFWSGSDADGTVDHYDVIMVDHPRSKDSIGPGGVDPVVVEVPAIDDPRWASTTATDSLFITLADTLRRDLRPHPEETPEDVRIVPFERWHTLFVRAVDNEGLPDPTPVYRSFNATTVAPTVELLHPTRPGYPLVVPSNFIMHWTGIDPTGQGESILPDSSRWVLIPSSIHPGDPDHYTSYPESLYAMPESAWSPWQDWDAADGTGRRAVFRGLPRTGEYPGSGYYIFAVQAKDEAGAVTPVFDWETPGKNNVALIRVSGAVAPYLTLKEPTFGTARFVGSVRPYTIEALAGQPLRFEWEADGSRYGGTIEAYRYGWNLVNPQDDSSWDADWSPDARSTERSFQSGTHRLSVQARDELGPVTSIEVHISIQSTFTGERRVLLVDDSNREIRPEEEQRSDSRWQAALESLASEANWEFDVNRDIYDVVDHRGVPPSLERLSPYAAVIWDVLPGPSGVAALRDLALFFDPIPERNFNPSQTNNHLHAYLGVGGKLWVNGFRPARSIWPTSGPDCLGCPVNVTNWDDPFEPHPQVDSVGTTSLLSKMGIEMFDVGSAVSSPRRSLQHFCQGFRVVQPGAPELIVDPEVWPNPPSPSGRVNIEIYNMPNTMAAQVPPLQPTPGISSVLYTYVSGVPEDPMSGTVYPQTADEQPVFIVARDEPDDACASRAFSGFEPYLLTPDSHRALVRHVLLNEMCLGSTPIAVQDFVARRSGGVVHIGWRVSAASHTTEFLLRAMDDVETWTVLYNADNPGEFSAADDTPRLALGNTVTYTLYARDAAADWRLVRELTVDASTAPLVTQLQAPRPNPFNPRTNIPFVLATRQHVTLEIFSLQGKRVATLVDGIQPPGSDTAVWEGVDTSRRPVASGVYIARLRSGETTMSRKIVLVR